MKAKKERKKESCGFSEEKEKYIFFRCLG